MSQESPNKTIKFDSSQIQNFVNTIFETGTLTARQLERIINRIATQKKKIRLEQINRINTGEFQIYLIKDAQQWQISYTLPIIGRTRKSLGTTDLVEALIKGFLEVNKAKDSISNDGITVEKLLKQISSEFLEWYMEKYPNRTEKYSIEDCIELIKREFSLWYLERNPLPGNTQGITLDFAINEAYLPYSEIKHSRRYHKSLNKYLSKITLNFFKELFGRVPHLEEIESRHIDKFIVWLKKSRNCGGSAINQYIFFIRSVFGFMINQNNYKGENPVLKRHKQPTKRKIDHLTREETKILSIRIREISDSADIKKRPQADLTKYYFSALFELLKQTGGRFSEVAMLKWEDFHPDHLIFRNTKNQKKDRMVPINVELYRYIKSLKFQHHEYVIGIQRYKRLKNFKADQYALDFITERNPEDIYNSFKHLWKAVRRELKLNPRITFHTLRNFFINTLLEEGYDIALIQYLVGHQNLETTSRYTRVTIERMRTAINAFNIAVDNGEKKNTPGIKLT